MAAHGASPCHATISANHGSSALAKLTMAKERPSKNAGREQSPLGHADHGENRTARARPPGRDRPKAATMAASISPRRSAQHLQHGDGADSGLGAGGDVRHAMRGRSWAEARCRAGTSLPAATSRSVTPAEVFGIGDQDFIGFLLAQIVGHSKSPRACAGPPGGRRSPSANDRQQHQARRDGGDGGSRPLSTYWQHLIGGSYPGVGERRR